MPAISPGKPLVFGALGPFDGYVSTFRAFETGEDGNPKPSYRCIFPEAPPPGTVASCEEAGILGAVAGVIGTLQATEVLKELLGIGQSLTGKLLIYDALGGRFETMTYAWDPENPLNGRAADDHKSRHSYAKSRVAYCSQRPRIATRRLAYFAAICRFTRLIRLAADFFRRERIPADRLGWYGSSTCRPHPICLTAGRSSPAMRKPALLKA